SAATAFAEPGQAAFDVGAPTADVRFQEAADLLDRPLGAARTQIHETYIVSQTRDGLVVVDQHAAHERIVYERLKASLARNGVQRQILLIPEIVELDEATVERLIARSDELASFGLAIESFGPGAVAVRETPSLLGKTDAASLLRDLAEHMAEWDTPPPQNHNLRIVVPPPLQFLETFRRGKFRRLGFFHHHPRARRQPAAIAQRGQRLFGQLFCVGWIEKHQRERLHRMRRAEI